MPYCMRGISSLEEGNMCCDGKFLVVVDRKGIGEFFRELRVRWITCGIRLDVGHPFECQCLKSSKRFIFRLYYYYYYYFMIGVLMCKTF